MFESLNELVLVSDVVMCPNSPKFVTEISRLRNITILCLKKKVIISHE